jgi:chemotaxis protein methyltransferase CheR
MNDMAKRINGETYFFRDHGQFDLLRLRLLPELINRGGEKKSLRLWSAGCASGEEAYSLAMLVDMLLPERDKWNILIIGSDIDRAALEKAKRGRYGAWSFRMVPATLQHRFFRKEGNEWLLDERIRRMVTFRALDLIKDAFPNDELREMDLILCRNVFIYFDSGTVAAVAAKQAATLNKNGYLMTGHTELIGLPVNILSSKLFSEGVAYQRTAPAAVIATAPPSHRTPLPAKPARIFSAPPPPLPDEKEILVTARKFADHGDYDQAEQACHRILLATPLAAEPHFLLAQLAQLRGNFEQAEALLNKTLYLDPRNVPAHLELAALCERAEKISKANTLRHAALNIIRTYPENAVIEPYETTAAEIARWLAQWEENVPLIPENRSTPVARNERAQHEH